MLITLIVGVLAAMSVVMAAGWAYQRAVRDSGWVDVFWTFGTGATCAVAALWPDLDALPARQWLVAAMAAIWSLRLGLYIAIRVRKGPEDARYTRLRESWGANYQRNLFGFMQLQAPCTALLALSVVFAAHNPTPGLRALDFAGLAILAVAIAGEGLADAQLARFRGDPANRGKINEIGLWSWSRHPNYFFEWFGWLAYPMIAIDAARPWSLLSLAAPAVMYLILTRFTGVPALEEHMARSRGAAWSDYAARVGAFFPRPPARKASS